MGKSPIGLIGVGLLGTALAERMAAAGLPLMGFDLDPSRAARLKELGGQFAATPREIAAACEQIVLCLPDSAVVATVVDELSAALAPGALLIDATTGDPNETTALARLLAQRGVGYVDATIAGSSEATVAGAPIGPIISVSSAPEGSVTSAVDVFTATCGSARNGRPRASPTQFVPGSPKSSGV